MLRSLWKFFGIVNLTIWLLLAISLNLAVGSQYAKQFREIFNQMNYLRFQDWVGQHSLTESWWVWTLLFLLVLFGLNTAVCTTDRLITLVRRRGEYGTGAFALLISPSLMHLCFLVVIAGHAVSLFGIQVRSAPVTPGARLSLGPVEVIANGQLTTYWNAPKLAGIARQYRVPLLLLCLLLGYVSHGFLGGRWIVIVAPSIKSRRSATVLVCKAVASSTTFPRIP